LLEPGVPSRGGTRNRLDITVSKPSQRRDEIRNRILEAANTLIAAHGYDGVTMRALAESSGVALKTLYHQFGSKANVLRVAVGESFSRSFADIEATEFDHGVDRLLYIVDGVHGATAQNAASAKSLFPVVVSRPSMSPVTSIYLDGYRRAISQIAAEGELVDWADVGLLASIVYRDITAVYSSWSEDRISLDLAGELAKLNACLSLTSLTTGYTQERLIKTARDLMGRHRGKTFL
jgi:AcrR family transcriptional regulator